MLLRIFDNIKQKQSQVIPGFAITGTRVFAALAIALAGIAVFFDLSLAQGGGTFHMPRAQATAAAIDKGGASGNLYTQTQKRYIQRAVVSSPDNLTKMHGETVLAAFDEPSLVRADLPTVVWQYRTGSCVLDVYFKSDRDDVVLAPVVHYEIRSRGYDSDADDLNEQRCIRSLVPSWGAPRMLSVNAIYKSLLR